MSESSAGTGRLFRSLRAEGAAADSAVPALSLDQAVGLKTVTLGSGADSPPPPLAAPPLVVPAVPANAGQSDAVQLAPVPAPEASHVAEAAPQAAPTTGRHAHAAPGVRATGIWLVVIGVTVVMGFADAIAFSGTQLGWLTGVSLLAASVYGALVVRREDEIVAVIAPPLAFFLATITAGQLTLPPTGDFIVREAFMIITTLGANAVWIFGSTLVALAIVFLRRRLADRARESDSSDTAERADLAQSR